MDSTKKLKRTMSMPCDDIEFNQKTILCYSERLICPGKLFNIDFHSPMHGTSDGIHDEDEHDTLTQTETQLEENILSHQSIVQPETFCDKIINSQSILRKSILESIV